MNLRYLALAAYGWLAANGHLLAQEAADAPKKKIGIFEAIGQAGAIGFVIIGLSVVAGTLIVEHFMSIKRDKLAPPEAIDEVEELLNEGNYQEVLEYCEAEPTFFTNVVAAGVRKLNYPFSAVEKALEESEDEESVKLHQKIGWLSLIAGLGPMLGLFGTVVGMVGAFGTIATEKSPEPSMFAGDIQLALMTTVLGLTVAIPVTAFYVFFRNRVTMLTIEIGGIVEELFERFREK
ncbi:MAG: MotA/TolQ/ExbB proton channel family protein [Planctomycetota bacterium]|nr:MAG: MotA/TolQ/ExbB proton channel family protein [Planctomycetota bacterium]